MTLTATKKPQRLRGPVDPEAGLSRLPGRDASWPASSHETRLIERTDGNPDGTNCRERDATHAAPFRSGRVREKRRRCIERGRADVPQQCRDAVHGRCNGAPVRGRLGRHVFMRP